MSDYTDSLRGAAPPLADGGNYTPQRLAGTGAAEASNSKPFSKDRLHMLSVGATPVRVLFAATGGLAAVVPTTGGAIIPANTLFTFRAGLKSAFVYVEAADGAAAYEASVWQREA